MIYEYKILNDKEILNGLTEIEKRFPQAVEGICREASNLIVSEARDWVAPKGTGSGRLKESIHAKVIKDDFGWRADIFAGENTWRPAKGKHGGPVNYALMQEYGFAPHIIHKSMWMGPVWTPSGEFATVRSFMPFMRPSLTSLESNIDSIISKQLAIIKNVRW